MNLFFYCLKSTVLGQVLIYNPKLCLIQCNLKQGLYCKSASEARCAHCCRPAQAELAYKRGGDRTVENTGMRHRTLAMFRECAAPSCSVEKRRGMASRIETTGGYWRPREDFQGRQADHSRIWIQFQNDHLTVDGQHDFRLRKAVNFNHRPEFQSGKRKHSKSRCCPPINNICKRDGRLAALAMPVSLAPKDTPHARTRPPATALI